MQTTDPEAIAQAREAWRIAISLLTDSGLSDANARRFFGGVLSKNKINARAVLRALQAGEVAATGNPTAWIAKAAQRAAERSGDPALKVEWT